MAGVRTGWWGALLYDIDQGLLLLAGELDEIKIMLGSGK